MIHSFNTLYNDKNVTITFFEDNKKRSIIVNKGTIAYDHTIDALQSTFNMSCYEDYKGDKGYIRTINHLRKTYIFKANVNNKSIFRPIHKSLILNS